MGGSANCSVEERRLADLHHVIDQRLCRPPSGLAQELEGGLLLGAEDNREGRGCSAHFGRFGALARRADRGDFIEIRGAVDEAHVGEGDSGESGLDGRVALLAALDGTEQVVAGGAGDRVPTNGDFRISRSGGENRWAPWGEVAARVSRWLDSTCYWCRWRSRRRPCSRRWHCSRDRCPCRWCR